MCARVAMCGEFEFEGSIFGQCNGAYLDQCPSLLTWTFDHKHMKHLLINVCNQFN
jgi:hypothetical protein